MCWYRSLYILHVGTDLMAHRVGWEGDGEGVGWDGVAGRG